MKTPSFRNPSDHWTKTPLHLLKLSSPEKLDTNTLKWTYATLYCGSGWEEEALDSSKEIRYWNFTQTQGLMEQRAYTCLRNRLLDGSPNRYSTDASCSARGLRFPGEKSRRRAFTCSLPYSVANNRAWHLAGSISGPPKWSRTKQKVRPLAGAVVLIGITGTVDADTKQTVGRSEWLINSATRQPRDKYVRDRGEGTARRVPRVVNTLLHSRKNLLSFQPFCKVTGVADRVFVFSQNCNPAPVLVIPTTPGRIQSYNMALQMTENSLSNDDSIVLSCHFLVILTGSWLFVLLGWWRCQFCVALEFLVIKVEKGLERNSCWLCKVMGVTDRVLSSFKIVIQLLFSIPTGSGRI